MQPHDALQTLGTDQVGHVGLVVLEEVFGEGGWAFRVDQDVESGLLVGVAVQVVCAEGSLLVVVEALPLVLLKLASVVGQGEAGGLIQAGGQAVGLRCSGTGIYAPSACRAPLLTRARSVDMDAQVEAVVLAKLVAQAVDDAATLAQLLRWCAQDDIVGQVDKHGKSRGLQLLLHAEAHFAAKLILVECSVGATVAAHVLAMGCAQDDDSSLLHFYIIYVVSDDA